jgi:hypothetical protein
LVASVVGRCGYSGPEFAKWVRELRPKLVGLIPQDS